MKTTMLVVLVLGLGACGGEGLPLEETTTAAPVGALAAPVPMDPSATTGALPCWVGLVSGQSAIETADNCTVLKPDSNLTLGSADRFVHAWVGPHARLCWGDTLDAPTECVGNTAPATIVFTAADVASATAFSAARYY